MTIRSCYPTSVRKLLVGLLVGLFVATVLVPSVAWAKTATKLTITANPSKATVTRKACINGVLKTSSGKAIAKQKVRLERYSDRSWKMVKTCTTNSAGKVSVEIQPAEDTKYRYRFLATKAHEKSTSATKVIQGYQIPNSMAKGSGMKVVKLALEAGLSVFDVHVGKAKSSVMGLTTEKGTLVAALGAGQGAYTLSRVVRVPTAGKYLLSVTTDGAWDVTVRQPRQLTASVPKTLTGTGTKATRLFSLKKGKWEVSWTQKGLYPMAFILFDREGNRVKGGDCTWPALSKGSTTISITKDSQYIMQVVSTASWSITFKQSSK